METSWNSHSDEIGVQNDFFFVCFHQLNLERYERYPFEIEEFQTAEYDELNHNSAHNKLTSHESQ